MNLSRAVAAAILVVGVFSRPIAPTAAADGSEQLLTVDHYVHVSSTVPATCWAKAPAAVLFDAVERPIARRAVPAPPVAVVIATNP